MDTKVTQDELIQMGEAVDRLLNDKAVQKVFAAQEQVYFRQWNSAETQSERELLWAKARALGELKEALKSTVNAGQHEVARIEREAKARNQH